MSSLGLRPRRRWLSFVVGSFALFTLSATTVGLSACAASRPNERTPMGVRPSPLDEASEQELTGARQREGIGPPKTTPESEVPPLGVHRPAPGAPASASATGSPPSPPP
jgi:hypothetical protein